MDLIYSSSILLTIKEYSSDKFATEIVFLFNRHEELGNISFGENWSSCLYNYRTNRISTCGETITYWKTSLTLEHQLNMV